MQIVAHRRGRDYLGWYKYILSRHDDTLYWAFTGHLPVESTPSAIIIETGRSPFLSKGGGFLGRVFKESDLNEN